MNTKNLNRRLKGYTKTSLRAGNEDSAVVDVIDDLQSITDEDDHSIDTSHDTSDVVDAEYLPNPAIVTEMMTEINEAPEITNADTAFKLLSDSNEALRRLDIIHMNVNYPVSGYRANNATILLADPGLESLVPNASLSKRRLSRALEDTKVQLVKAAFQTFIKWLQERFNQGISRLRALFSKKDKTATPDDIKIISKAINDSEIVTPPSQGAYENTTKSIGYSEEEPTLPKKSKRGAGPSSTQTESPTVELGQITDPVPMKVYVRSVYEQKVWLGLKHWSRILIENPEEAEKLVTNTVIISENISNFLGGVAKLYDSFLEDDGANATSLDNFERANVKLIKTLNETYEITQKFIRDDSGEAPGLPEFLSRSQVILSMRDRFKPEGFINTQKQCQDTLKAMGGWSNKPLSYNYTEMADGLNRLRGLLLSIGTLYNMLPILVTGMNDINTSVIDVSAAISKVSLKPVR